MTTAEVDAGALARSARPKQAEDRPGRDAQRKVAQHNLSAELLPKALVRNAGALLLMLCLTRACGASLIGDLQPVCQWMQQGAAPQPQSAVVHPCSP